MATIRIELTKHWQVKPYEHEEIRLCYEEEVPTASLDFRADKKGIRREDAAAELVTALHISLDKALGAAMVRALGRADPRDAEAALGAPLPNLTAPDLAAVQKAHGIRPAQSESERKRLEAQHGRIPTRR